MHFFVTSTEPGATFSARHFLVGMVECNPESVEGYLENEAVQSLVSRKLASTNPPFCRMIASTRK